MIVKNREQQELVATYKAGTSMNRNTYQRRRKKKSVQKIDIGPPAIITISDETEEELFTYDRFGRKKKF